MKPSPGLESTLLDLHREHQYSRGYPIVALSFQGVINVYEGIIHGNQRDGNSGGEICSRDDFCDGIFNVTSH